MLDRRTVLSRLQAPAAADDTIVAPPTRPVGRTNTPILDVVWRRRWVVIGSVLLALAAAIAYLVRTTPIYASTSRIYIEPPLKIFGDGVAAGPNSQGYLFTQAELMKSSAILTGALETPEAQQVEALRGSDNPVGFLKSAVDVTVVTKGDIIAVAAESPRPADAALLVNAVVDAYIVHHNKRHRSTAGEVWKVLNTEKVKYEGEFKTLSDAILKFQQAHGAVKFEGERGNIAVGRLAELSDAVTKAQLQAMDARVTLESAQALARQPARFREFMRAQREQSAEAGGAAAAQADPRVAELASVEGKVRWMRDQFGENYPPLRALESQAADLRIQLQDAEAPAALPGPNESASDQKYVESWLAVMQENLARANRREAALAGMFGAQQAEALKLNAKAAELAQMEVNARRLEKVLDVLDTRMKEVDVNTGAINTVTVLEVARPEAAPVRPNRGRTLGLAVLVGLVLGLGGALALDLADQRLRSAEEIGDLLGIPVLGVVPDILGKLTPVQRGQEIHLQPRSDVAEAYRTVRTAIYFGAPDVRSKTILVTSPSPGDGKSTMASNLALAIAQADRRVLLIDADCRKPVQHRTFGLDPGVGLSSVLVGRATADQAIRQGAAGNLDVMPCGPLPPNPAELLAGKAFADLLAELSLRYDQIVIDSPPVVPVTDARILAAAADLTVLVLRAEKSTRRLSEHARDALASVGANLLGAVVNAVPRTRGRHGYYYGSYGDAYGYDTAANGSGRKNGRSNGVKVLTAAPPSEAGPV